MPLGAVYTPAWLAGLVMRETLARAGDPVSMTVCDPTCGDGRFLLAAQEAGIPPERLYGVDRDAAAVAAARAAVPGANLETGEALVGLDWERAFPGTGGTFDLLVGNPPFVRIQDLRKHDPALADGLAARYESAAGNFDLYGPVLELALARMRVAAGFVVPHRFFKTEYGRALRDRLAPHVALIADFGDRPVFGQDAQTYICALVLVRRSRPHFVYSRAWGDGTDGSGEVPRAALTPAVWLPLLPDELRTYERIAEGAVPLLGAPGSPAARLFVGLQTPANRVYRLEPLDDRGDELLVRSAAEPSPFRIERQVTRPLLMGADIRAFRIADKGRMVLLPYRRGALLDLPAEAPLAAAYLRRHQAGPLAGAWWEWPYPKNLGAFEQPKLLVGGVAARGRYAYDATGAYYVVGGGDGGYSLLPQPGVDPWALLGLLSSAVMDYALQRRSAMFAGRCYSYGRRFLHDLPIRLAALTPALAELARERASASGARATDLDRELDRQVGEAYALTRSDWAAINRLVPARKV
ncbi:MAG: Eco57I restriction-modification methylase domain-containing protein [Candidatus Sericytochromatia bacterium]|nr:Eco57I restriction-modification methylase domain-containing protein [Candidatus Tanganyikabacteria bacterium]